MIEQNHQATQPQQRIFQYAPKRVGDSLNSEILPLTPEMLEQSQMKCISYFHTLTVSNIDFEKYQKVLHTVMYKYNSMNVELFRLKYLLERISEGAVLKLKRIKLLYDPHFQPVQKLANKLKLLYSKGRKETNQDHGYDRIDNCIERCQKFQTSYFKDTLNINITQQRELYEQLYSLKRRFNIINPKSVSHYVTHPVTSLPPKTKFIVNFYDQHLMTYQNQPVPFPPNLLFCPFLLENDEYKISPEYYQQLGQYLTQWNNKVLTIEIANQSRTKFVSYIRLEYAQSGNIVEKITLIRDKVFQFMIFQFLKHVVCTKKNLLLLPTSHPSIMIRISLKSMPKSDTNPPMEFISILMALLKDEKTYALSKTDIVDKIRFTIEEALVSKLLPSCPSLIVQCAKQQYTKYYRKVQYNYLIINHLEVLGRLAD